MAWHPFRNPGLKIVALLLGTLLWFMNRGHQIEVRRSVPLSYSNVPTPLELTGDQADTVSVQLRGNDNLLGSLGTGDIRLIVDLSGAHSGRNLSPLRLDEVITPLGVEVLQVEPATVAVSLERTGQVNAPVEAAVDGQPAQGYVLKGVLVTPTTVPVVGPESRLQDGISVITERVSVEGRSASFTESVRAGVVDAQFRLREPQTVRVTVTIERERPSP
jgi:YbbR domain-containing protein